MKKIITFFTIIGIFFLSVTHLLGANLKGVSQFNNIVIFIKFADETSYVAPHPLSFYEDLFNSDTQPSLKGYYLESSYNQLTINSFLVKNSDTQFLYYVDSHNRNYYEPYNRFSNPTGYTTDAASREHNLLKNAITYVDTLNLVPDSLNLDTNHDNYIDSLTFIVSGEDNGWSSLFWPHKWSLYAYDGTRPKLNNVYAYDYTFELLGNSPDYYYAVNLGVLSHETFHLIGAPDLYHYYAYDNLNPVGNWGLMEFVGHVPSHMLGYMKYQYGGWIDEVQEITQSGTYTLYPLQDSGQNLYRINTGFSNEWIYLEYRDDQGLYESTLPQTGLLVYRVDMDFVNQGNVNGYYDDNMNTVNEVFVFRPEMADTTSPFTFVDNTNYTAQGNYDLAALSDLNPYHEAGLNTAIPIFNSLGESIDLTISNVVEQDGYITFDVDLHTPIAIELDYTESLPDSVILWDNALMDYHVTLSNIDPNYTAYYTTDGSIPTQSSPVYQGNTIAIDGSHNQVSVSLYDGNTFVSTTSKTFQFSDTIESVHYPYGDNLNQYWFLNFKENKAYKWQFDSSSELEADYDFLTLYNNEYNQTYTDVFGSETLYLNTQSMIVLLTSDTNTSNYYGFKLNITEIVPLTLSLIGDSEITVDVFTPYEEEGAVLSGDNPEGYVITASGFYDTNTVGDYVIQYTVKDQLGEVLLEVTRNIHVVDTTIPTITLSNDHITLEKGEPFIPPVITVNDNYDAHPSVHVYGSVDIDTVGTYLIGYEAEDSSHNTSIIITLTVTVVDTQSPAATLNPNVDTILVNDDYVDSLYQTDETDITETILTNLDTTQAGTYYIHYILKDSYNNTTELWRFITVLDPSPSIHFELQPMVSSVEVGTVIEDYNCLVTINGETTGCEIVDNTLEVMTPGDYEVTLGVTVEGVIFTYKRYIYVYEKNVPVQLFIKKEEVLV